MTDVFLDLMVKELVTVALNDNRIMHRIIDQREKVRVEGLLDKGEVTAVITFKPELLAEVIEATDKEEINETTGYLYADGETDSDS